MLRRSGFGLSGGILEGSALCRFSFSYAAMRSSSCFAKSTAAQILSAESSVSIVRRPARPDSAVVTLCASESSFVPFCKSNRSLFLRSSSSISMPAVSSNMESNLFSFSSSRKKGSLVRS